MCIKEIMFTLIFETVFEFALMRLIKFICRLMPWIVLEQDILWLSAGNRILGLKRTPYGIRWSPHVTLRGHKEDVCRFVSNGDLIVSGGR